MGTFYTQYILERMNQSESQNKYQKLYGKSEHMNMIEMGKSQCAENMNEKTKNHRKKQRQTYYSYNFLFL